MYRHSARRVCPVCKNWELNPIEVIPKPICPNYRGDFSRGEIEGQDGFGDFRRIVQDFGALIGGWKVQSIPSDMLISSLHEIDKGRVGVREVLA